MNKRSFSEVTISKNPHIQNQKRKNAKLQNKQQMQILKLNQENALLHKKVNESTPILQTIYQKMKKKQHFYQRQIQEKENTNQLVQQMAKQYKKFSEDGIQLINKHEIIDKHSGLSNYRSVSCNYLAHPAQLDRMQYHSVNNFKQNQSSNINIVELYKTSLSNTNLANRRSVYEIYKTRIQQNNIEQSTLNRVRRLSKQMDKDLQELSIKKNKSLTNLNEKNTIKPAPLVTKPKKDKRQYFLELQRRKFAQLR